MLRVFAVPLIALFALSTVGCDTPCDGNRVCEVTRPGSDPTQFQVCDGSRFVTCDASTTGKRVACVTLASHYVCTPSGWTQVP